MNWLAVEDVTGGGLDILYQYGAIGVVAALLTVFARASYKRETDRSDRLEGEVFRLHQVIQERHIPALESAAHALQEATFALREIQQDRDLERALRDRDRGER